MRTGGDGGVATPCSPFDPAPALDEPSPNEHLRLVTRDDVGSADRTEVSLDELAGEGAAIVIAGLDPSTAERALRWGANHQVPVVALVPPPSADLAQGFGFVLGESRSRVVEAMAQAVPALANEAAAPVVDASEIAQFPPQGGRVGAVTLLPPVSCDIPATRAGDPRFPITQWDSANTRAWLVSGSPGCARDVTSELSVARARGVVALTLEAAALPPHAPGLRVVSAAAGVVPEGASNEPLDDEQRRFAATLGHASWWTALGRDGATLARIAVRGLPVVPATDPAAVAQRRALARDALAGARARLWSTEATGWNDTHAMRRTVCAIDAPAR
jgi:hypothetical protein